MACTAQDAGTMYGCLCYCSACLDALSRPKGAKKDHCGNHFKGCHAKCAPVKK